MPYVVLYAATVHSYNSATCLHHDKVNKDACLLSFVHLIQLVHTSIRYTHIYILRTIPSMTAEGGPGPSTMASSPLLPNSATQLRVKKRMINIVNPAGTYLDLELLMFDILSQISNSAYRSG